MHKGHIVYIGLAVFALFSGYQIGSAIYQTFLAGTLNPSGGGAQQAPLGGG